MPGEWTKLRCRQIVVMSTHSALRTLTISIADYILWNARVAITIVIQRRFNVLPLDYNLKLHMS